MHGRRYRYSGVGERTKPRRYKLFTLSLLALVLFPASFAQTALASEILVVDTHAFEFLGMTVNGDGTSTWAYHVISGRKPSLSHWVLEFPSSLDESHVVDASENYEVGDDPKTGVYGFKFDEGYRNDEDREVWFTLDGHYELGTTHIATKAGRNVAVDGVISGPSGDILAEVNELPIAGDDVASTEENADVIIRVLANDRDPDGTLDPGSVEITKAPKEGSAHVDPSTGDVTYTPSPGTCGDDYFKYTVRDNDGLTSDEARVEVDILCNLAPVAGDVQAITEENASVTLAVTANDTDADGEIDPSTIEIAKSPKKGSVYVDPSTGDITYSPEPGFCGSDYFKYTVRDNDEAESNEAKVEIDVLCNQAPVAEDDQALTEENTPVTIDVVANDVDSDGTIDPSTVEITKSPKSGEVSVHPSSGAIVYTPAPGSCGDDYFKYTVSDNDGQVSDQARVEVDVLCNQSPEAEDDQATTDENTSVTIDVVANDMDSDGTIDPSTVAITKSPKSGQVNVHPSSGAITYTPNPGTCGGDYFKYTLRDNDGAESDEAKVEVEVLCGEPPLAIDDLYTVTEGQTLQVADPGILTNDVTAPTDPLTAILVSNVKHGLLELRDDGSFEYVHDGSETASDSFRYKASDGYDDSNVATVSIVIHPANDAPSASDNEDKTDEDESVQIDVLKNDSDPDGDALSVDWVGSPENGSASNNGNSVTYTPAPDFHGFDAFTYGVSDSNGGTAEATVTIEVEPVNDPPVAQNDSAATAEDSSVNVLVLDNDDDPDGDELVIESPSKPSNGTVRIDGRSVTYTPDPDFDGIDAFTYAVSDGHGGRSEATVTITIAPVNDEPSAGDDDATTDEDTAISIRVLTNDTDPEGDDLTVVSTTQPSHGSAEVHGDEVLYTPEDNFYGVDQFSYDISDGRGGSASAHVEVNVRPVNDPVLANDDRGTTPEDIAITLEVLENDADPEDDELTITSISQPAHGTTSHDGIRITYTPDPDFHGEDEFTYSVSDGEDGTASATVLIIVIPTNDPPLAQNDAEEGSEDASVSIDVLANDSDPDEDSLVLQSLTQPEHGAATIDGDLIVYTPELDFHGTETFTYTISDGNGGSDTAEVLVSIAGVNDLPVAQNDSASTDEEALVEIFVLANDHDPDGDFLIVESTTTPGHGSVINAGTSVSYIPEDGFQGIDTFSYTVSDNNGGTAAADVTISVAGVNDLPIAQDDSTVTDEGTPVTVSVLENDSDPDGDSLSIESVTQPASGTVTNNALDITYEPNSGFHGIDTFTYAVSDGNGGVASAQVTVAVAAVNDPPIAQDDDAATQEETPVNVHVLLNDSDPDGDSLTIESVTQPDHGSVINHGDQITYSPDPEYHGSDTFTYTISDGKAATATATVRISVAQVNDLPVALDDSENTSEEASIEIPVLGNDSDPDGDRLEIVSVTEPEHGSVVFDEESIIYTPDTDFSGLDTFTYTVIDGQGGQATATVTLSVAPVNDPPVAQNDTDATYENVPIALAVLLNDTDPEDDLLEIESVTSPIHGTVSVEGESIIYAPEPGYEGEDAFSYTVSDGNGGIAQAEVTVTVIGTNDAPVAVNDAMATSEDRPVTISVLANDSDPDADPIQIESVSRPLHGTATSSGASIVYTPAPGFSGEDSFTYTLTDGKGGTDTATVSIDVVATNDAPIAQDDSHATGEDQALTIPVLANDSDPDGDPLIVESIDQPEHGTVVNNSVALTYTPDPGFSGADAFSYTVSDGNGKTDTATVVVVVTTVNDPPVAQDDSASTLENTMVMIPILENDSDPDGDFLLVESFSQPAHGTVLNSRTGVSYVPDPGFQGIDHFTYTVSDGNGGSATANVTVSVAEVNDAPSAQDDSAITDEGLPVTIPALLNDSDPDGDSLRIESVTQPDRGTVTQDGTDVIYTPDPGTNGVDSFSYTVSDGHGETATATIFVAVAPVNDPPVAQDDSASTDQQTAVDIDVLANDTDPDGDALFIEAVTQPQAGSVENLGDRLAYTPDSTFTGSDRLTYTVSDGRGNTATATVIIGVDGSGGGGGAEEIESCDGKVIISEIAWAGTASDEQDEWIELRNLGTTPVDLTGWVLRWRRTHPSTPEDQVWKVVELSGTLPGARIAACDGSSDDEPTVRFIKEDPNDTAWLVESSTSDLDAGYFTLERRHDNTVSDIDADLLYDTAQTPHLDLSDQGDVIMLLDPQGNVVDTANAAYLGRNGWAAGSASSYGTMERIDPLGPDTEENWHTNLGVDIEGDDVRGRPLRATPGRANSPVLENLDLNADIKPVTIRAGETISVDFPLSRTDRRSTGWPWITVARPGFAGLAGSGGASDYVNYAFSGGYENGEQYVLNIETGGLPAGTYTFWIVYGEGRAALVPIIVTP